MPLLTCGVGAFSKAAEASHLCTTDSPLGPRTVGYQNGADWTWFGGRMVQALVQHGMLDDALAELRPMVDRICEFNGLNEWWSPAGRPSGSGAFHGAAGVVGKAIEMLDAALLRR